jgi:hypothetical protein
MFDASLDSEIVAREEGGIVGRVEGPPGADVEGQE